MCKVNQISFYCPHILALIFPRYTTAIAKLFFLKKLLKSWRAARIRGVRGVMSPNFWIFLTLHHIFLNHLINIWTCKIWIEYIFLSRNFFFIWRLKSQTVQKLSNMSFSIWQFSAIFSNVLLSFWFKILFLFNVGQIFILFLGCARNTWWAGSSDPKQYRSCRIYRWSIDDRWGRWWKQHLNLNRWSHVHGCKRILMGFFLGILEFSLFFNFVLWAKNYTYCYIY